LKDIHFQMRKHPDPRIRQKFLSAWDLYKQRYGAMLTALEQGGFALSSLATHNYWRDEERAMVHAIRAFKRAGKK